MSIEKANIALLKKRWDGCTRCEIHKQRGRNEKIVYGGGSMPADFLFIYDTPEEEDMKAGSPSMGRFGSMLFEMIMDADFPKGSFAFTTLVGCRPFTVLPAVDENTPARVVNKASSNVEREACRSRLREIVYAIDPQLILAVGKEAWETLVAHKDRGGSRDFKDAIGEFYWHDLQGRWREVRYPVLALPHPRDIFNDPSHAEHGPIVGTIETLLKAKKHVETLNKEKHG